MFCGFLAGLTTCMFLSCAGCVNASAAEYSYEAVTGSMTILRCALEALPKQDWKGNWLPLAY